MLGTTRIRVGDWFVQMRVKVGTAGSTVLKVVDKDVFEFYPKAYPVSVEVTDDAIGIVKFQVRILNKLIERLPVFEEGDLTVSLAQGTPILVYRELLALFLQPHMGKCTESTQNTYVEDFPKEAFIEMLYHIYPTLRPLHCNMRNLAKAAVAFQAMPIVYKLSENLWNFNIRSMSLEQKLQSALDLELGPAIEELVYRATQNGVWDHLVKLGFEPETFFGTEVYRRLVCPAVFAGRQNEYGTQFATRPCTPPDFFSVESSLNTSNVTVMFRRTPFFVNRGLIQVHGTSKFTVTSEGHLQALFSKEMEEQCAKGVLLPGEMSCQKLSYMEFFLGVGSIVFVALSVRTEVPPHFLRAAIVFCHDHDWSHVKSQLEQSLLQQPAESYDEYRDQIVFAEKFNLRNLIAVCVQRAEAREPTSFRERQVGLTSGGPQCSDDEQNMATLAELNSEYYFGPVGEFRVVEDSD